MVEGEGEGYLVFRRPWPGMMRTLYGNHERFQSTYFDRFHGFYCTGDGEYTVIYIKLLGLFAWVEEVDFSGRYFEMDRED